MIASLRRSVFLIRPPTQMGALFKIVSAQHPVNLLYVAASLREHGFEPRVIDYEVEPWDAKQLLAEVDRLDPLFVGVTCMTPLVVTGHEICKIVKEAYPDCPTVVAGAHPTALPKRTLEEFPFFDIALFGEGEHTAVELCHRLIRGRDLSGVAGAAFRAGGRIAVGPERPLFKPLDALPFPARDLLDLARYPGASKSGMPAEVYRSTQVFTSRGCPFLCTFCAIPVAHNNKVRFRTAEKVRQELEECVHRYGIRHVTLHDDTFTLSVRRVREISEAVGSLGITWDCDTRVDQVTREMLEAMAANGCVRVAFGVESGSPRILKLIKKNVTLAQIKSAFTWAKGAGMMTSGYFIVGSHPEETYEEVEATRRLMRDVAPDFANVAVGVPYPGTELEMELKKRNLLLDPAWERYMEYSAVPGWRTLAFSAEELVAEQKRLIRDFFYRPGYVWGRMRKAGGRLARARSVSDLKSCAREWQYWVRSALIGYEFVQQTVGGKGKLKPLPTTHC